MKRITAIAAACLLAANCRPDSSHYAMADCRVKTQAVAAEIVAVPVAVSIGVPVAAAAPYYYSYQQFAPQTQSVDVEAIAARVVEKLRVAEGPRALDTPNTPTPMPATMLVQKCLKCHAGANPKGGLSLENLAALSCEIRLKAVRAVLAEKMPKGGPRLTPEEAGRVLEELTKPNDK
jgi:hypothetical protein